jgi:phosphoribosylanthranilate isomerase
MLSGVKIKVCGMRNTENIREVAALSPDYMGFIFYEKSTRYVGSEFVLPDDLDSTINRVGVFVNHSKAFIKEKAVRHQLNYVQLHGDESVTFCEELKTEGIRVIKVFRVDEDFDFRGTKQFERVADFFLFDTKGKRYGGNAIPFDWSLLNQYNQVVPFFLSGGIQSDNVRQLKNISTLNIHAIDVNSGVEDQPGLKNVNKISEIINQLSL